MTILNETLNPINSDERRKINENWQMISNRLSSLQNQILLISGGNNVDAIIERIQAAIDSAEQASTDANAAVEQVNSALSQLQDMIETANMLNDNVQAALDELNLALNSMSYLGLYDANATYVKGNFVRLQKDSYVALKTNTGITPSDNGVDWRLVAVGGVDGEGAVSTVNGVQPNAQGDVELDVLTSTDLQNINDDLNKKSNVLRADQTLDIYVSTTGSDSNDGLTAANPLATLQRAFDYLKQSYSNLDGTVRIRLAPGVYEQNLFIDSLLSRNRIQVLGAVDSNNVPTVIFDGANNANLLYAMTFSSNMQVLVSNIGVRNFANNSGRSGIVAQQHTNLWTQNVHVSNCGFAGINVNASCTLYVEGGIIDNCRIGIRVYSNSIVTAGYRNPTQSYNDPNRLIVRNCTESGMLVYNMSTGHADFSEFNGNRNGITIQNSSRLHVWRNAFRNSTVYGVFATTSSTWFDDDNLYENNATNSRMSAYSTELAQSDFYTPISQIRPYTYLERVNHTGVTTETFFNTIDPQLNYRLLGNTLVRPGQKLKVTIGGVFAGAGTKTVYLRLDTGLVAGFTSTNGSVRNFKMEVEMYVVSSGSLKVVATFIEGISAYNVLISPRNLGLTTNRNLTVTGQLNDAAGSIAIETFDVREEL